METELRHVVERENRVEELMDKIIEHKLNEYDSRVALVESEVNSLNKQLSELKATTDILQRDSQELHGETLKRFIEFAEKLGQISKEVSLIQESLHNEDKIVEKIREHEINAVSNLKSFEKKALKNLNRQLTSKKTLDNVLKKLLNGKNKAKLDRAIRTASTSPKVRTSLVNAVLNDKKLRSKLVNDVLVGTRGKLKREKVTSRVAKAATKKLIENAQTGLKKAAKSAAKKAVKTEAAKTA